MNENISIMRRKLKKKLSESRYEHTLSVSFTCVCLAMRYGYPLEKAEIAAPQTPVMPAKGAVSAALPWVLVAAVVLITAALLWPLRKKRRK